MEVNPIGAGRRQLGPNRVKSLLYTIGSLNSVYVILILTNEKKYELKIGVGNPIGVGGGAQLGPNRVESLLYTIGSLNSVCDPNIN